MGGEGLKWKPITLVVPSGVRKLWQYSLKSM